MRGRSQKYWRRRACGLTLVEALAGTALMATVLVAILLAAGRMKAQSRGAAMREEGCLIADGLLRAWWPDRHKLPRDARGAVGGKAGWHWRTRRVASEEAAALGGEIVALEVFAPGGSGEPAARVEIVLPGEDKGEDDAGQGTDAR